MALKDRLIDCRAVLMSYRALLMGNSVSQCVAVCCSMLQCVVVCCIALQCVAVCCSVLQCAVLPPVTFLENKYASGERMEKKRIEQFWKGGGNLRC